MTDTDMGFALNGDGEYVSVRALSVRDAAALADRLRTAGYASADAFGGYVFVSPDDARRLEAASRVF